MAQVAAAGSGRALARCKDSAWADARAPLEASKHDDAGEVLLSDATGEHLLEGLVTNFFAIDAEGCLLTAPAHLVLHGHMRALVIAAARARGLRVLLRAPNVQQARSWRGAFLTSAARLPQPIAELRCPCLPGAPLYGFADFGPVLEVQRLVQEALESGRLPQDQGPETKTPAI